MRRQGALEQQQRFVHHVGHVHRAQRQRLLARKGQQPLDQRGTPARGLQRRQQVFGHVRLVGVALLQRDQVANHHRQQVIEVVRQTAGELPGGFHFLRMHQRRLGVLEVGDIDRQHEAARHAALGVEFGHQLAAGIHQPATGTAHGVFVADALTLERPVHMARNIGVDLVAHHVANGAAHHAFPDCAKPVGVALVGIAVDFIAVEVADQRRHGVGDQAQVFLAAAQRFGDALVGVVGQDQAPVGRLQFMRALGHPALQLDVLLLDLQLVAPAGGDVGVQRDKAVVRQRLAAHRQNLPVGPVALGVVRREMPRQAHALGHQFFHIARPVFAALGVVAHEGLEGGTDKRHVLGEIKQAQEGFVPGHDAQVAVDHRQPLVKPVQPGLEQLVSIVDGREIRGNV